MSSNPASGPLGGASVTPFGCQTGACVLHGAAPEGVALDLVDEGPLLLAGLPGGMRVTHLEGAGLEDPDEEPDRALQGHRGRFGVDRAVTNLRWEWDPVKVTGSQGSTSTYTDHDHLRQTCVFPVRADLKAGPRL